MSERRDDRNGATSRLTAWLIVAWMALVIGAYLVENGDYFRAKLRAFLPLLLGG